MRAPATRMVPLAAAALSLGCLVESPPSEARADVAPVAAIDAACPLVVVGTDVFVQDRDDGIEMVFVTREGVDDLRARVRHVAAIYGPDTRRGPGHAGGHGTSGQRHGLRLWAAPAASAEVEDVERGAVMRLVAVRPEETEALQAHVREQLARISQVPCG